jgi:hypothetical protein
MAILLTAVLSTSNNAESIGSILPLSAILIAQLRRAGMLWLLLKISDGFAKMSHGSAP